MSLSAANKSPIRITGAFFARIQGTSQNGSQIETKSMVYVSADVKGFYLSEDTMYGLGMLARDFPRPGCALSSSSISQATELPDSNVQSVSGEPHHSSLNNHTCACPQRQPVPDRPSKLPFDCTPENNEKMKQWCMEEFGSSTFNVCPHQPLPCMAGPPMKIHVDENAKPFVCHKAAPVPIGWDEMHKEDLDNDVTMEVIEPVPIGEPVTWCFRTVLSRKSDGRCRRTVDYTPMNKYCKRETHVVESPMVVARRVPRKTWKTVTDLWHGFHQIPIAEEDRHYTTFITKNGRFRYKRVPQGFVASGDALNNRLDAIFADFRNKERLMDDTIYFDESLEDHWWRTIDFLITAGKAGCVMNPKKFQFARREVDFAGFRISEEKIEPLPKFFDAIRNFPSPKSTTDIRSWFGLVNQVASYAQLREHLEPFRPFLSPKHKFEWTDELDLAFEAGKESIIKAIQNGIEIFDPHLPTCLRPDWSTKGVGYVLLQKHCACKSVTPDCCTNGWRITLAGSRFLLGRETRYAPIEGEALAVAWALEHSRFFTLGCDNLVVVTDHKPLTKILGDRTLDEIHNPRLFRLKQRTLPWRFSIVHLPGDTNSAADAISRYPTTHDPEAQIFSEEEEAEVSAIKFSMQSDLTVSWDDMVSHTQQDPDLCAILVYIQDGFPTNCPDSEVLHSFWQYRKALYELDGVIMYDDRVVVPRTLRQKVLRMFHAAHQGVSTMEQRARELVFWPGMTLSFDGIRASCQECTANAPSQPKQPAAPFDPPSLPFEKIVADFFNAGGNHYLVIADRLSSWTEVFKCTSGSPQSGANGLIECLRNVFMRFGVPVEVSSDGGPEFVATKTKEFFKTWGINHRLSSAYHPQSNGRAEVAVKTAKRLLRNNTGPSGTLNTDQFLLAMLQLRNTPDPDCKLSPAQILFGRPLRDAFAFASRLEKYSNANYRPLWRNAWEAKEDALRHRYHKTAEAINELSRPLSKLQVGDQCYVQNMEGNYPKRWDRSGVVVEDQGHDSYLIKIDGSGRLAKRNRKHLRKFSPTSPMFSVPHHLPSVPKMAQKSLLTSQSPVPEHQNQFQLPKQIQPIAGPLMQTDAHSSAQESQVKDPVATDSNMGRPKRDKRKPAQYDASTGKWT